MIAALFGPAVLLPAAAGVQEGEGQSPFDPLTACVQESRSLAVLFLVDTSGSLQDTDPRGLRADGIGVALRGLANLAALPDGPDVFVDFLDFGTRTTRSFPARDQWASVDRDIDRLLAEAEDFAERDDAQDTDYVAALEPWFDRADPNRPPDEVGAIELLERAPADACRLLAWFSDGMLDLDYVDGPKTLPWPEEPYEVTSDAVADAFEPVAEEFLCRRGGVVDRLRGGVSLEEGGVFIAAVGFGQSSEFGLLRSIAEGRAGRQSCGDLRLPHFGTFLSANTNDLIEALFKIGNPVGPFFLCTPESPCGTRVPFELNESLTRFTLLVLTGGNGVTASLVGPGNDDDFVLRPSAVAAQTLRNGVELDIELLGGDAYLIDGTLPLDQRTWAGEWHLRFAVETNEDLLDLSRVALVVAGEIEARLRDEDLRAYSGESGSFVVELVNAAGEPVSRAAFGPGSELTVKLDGRPLTTPAIGSDGTFQFTFDIGTGVEGDLSIDAVLQTEVAVIEDRPPYVLPLWEGPLGIITIEPPPTHPVVDAAASWSTDRFEDPDDGEPVLVASTTARAWAPDANGGGCVSLDGFDFRKPVGMEGEPRFEVRTTDGRALSGDEECGLLLESGQEEILELAVSLDDDQLRLGKSLDPDDLVIQYRFTTTSDLDEAEGATYDGSNTWLVVPTTKVTTDPWKVAFLVLAAIAPPLLLLYAYNFFIASKFERMSPAVAGKVRVRVRNSDGVKLIRDGGPSGAPLGTIDDLDAVNAPGSRQREATVTRLQPPDELARFQVRGFPPLFGEPKGYGTTPGLEPAYVFGQEGISKDMTRAIVPLSLGRGWLLRVERDSLESALAKAREQADGGLATGAPTDPLAWAEFDASLVVLLSTANASETAVREAFGHVEDEVGKVLERDLPQVLAAVAAGAEPEEPAPPAPGTALPTDERPYEMDLPADPEHGMSTLPGDDPAPAPAPAEKGKRRRSSRRGRKARDKQEGAPPPADPPGAADPGNGIDHGELPP